jgi:predicted ATPase/class 3 adenylate cyclase/DNA-binding CsgD family transcriptional regulator
VYVGVTAGLVTLLFTDIEGNVRLWEADRDAMAAASARLDRIVREQVEASGGHVFKTVGEVHRAVFADPVAALSSAVAIQRAAGGEPWPSSLPIRVCMALHSGACAERDGDYFGPVVNRAARLLDVGHGGQVLVTAAAYALVAGRLPGGIGLRDLGEQRLRDLGRAERVFQVTGSGLAEGFGVLRSLDHPALRHNLPSQATSFVGRVAELAELRALMSGGSRLVTIAGPGGIGKSRLALQAAADVLDGTGDGVWLVEFAPVAEPELVARTAAAALGVREVPGRPTLDTLIDALGDQDLLLILDNAEHVLGAVAELADAIIRSCPQVCLLVTSREPLGASGEHVFRVPGLTVPPADLAAPGRLAAFESVQLFAQHAALHQRGFTVDDANAAAVAAICVRLDGIPLALELAAARLGSLSASEINARLDQRFRLLTTGNRTALPRHQTLRALIDWSYDLLSPDERSVFDRLSVFAGAWTLDAAEAVACGGDVAEWQVLDLLAALVGKSLVQAEVIHGSTRYRLLETVRHYAAERLALRASSDLRDARVAHRDHYLALAEAAAAHLTGPDQGSWLDRLDADQANLRRAGEHAIGDPDGTGLVLRLGVALYRYGIARSRQQQALELLMPAVRRPDAGADPALFAAALVTAAHTASWVDIGASRHLAEQAVQVARQLGDDRLLSGALAALCTAWHFGGETQTGRPFGQESVERARRLGDDVLLGESLAHYVLTVDPVRSPQLVSEAIACTERSGDHLYNCLLHNNAGIHALMVEDIPVARAHLEAVAKAAQQVGWESAELPANVGLMLRAEGDLDGARSMFEASLRSSRRSGYRRGMAYGFLYLTCVAGDLGDWDRAAVLHGSVQAFQDRTGAPWDDFDARYRQDSLVRARAHLGDEQLERAYAQGMALSLEKALDLALSSEAGLRDRDHAAAHATPDDAVFDAARRPGRTLSQADAIALALGTAQRVPGPAPAVTVPVARRGPADSQAGPLSARERQIMALLAGGASDAKIAETLFVTPNTVRTHLDRIRDKTCARNRAELTRYAIQAGIEPVVPSP